MLINFEDLAMNTVESLGDVLSPGLIVALSLLGLFPLIARKLIRWLRVWRPRQESEEG